MDCIAHRGFASVNPENTLPAVERAVSRGVYGVEVDVRRCGTGELVVCHDATVDRVTGATGAVADLPLSTLQTLDVLGSGAGVPTLEAVVETLPADVTLHAEAKERGLGGDVVSLASRSAVAVTVSAFDPAVLEEEALASPSVDLALLVPPADLDDELATSIERDPLDIATSLSCVAIHPHHSRCTTAVVDRAHDLDLRVNAWTIGDRTTARDLEAAGVDGLIADAPEACLRDSRGSGEV